MSRPDMLFGVIVPSPHAHAGIAGYDVTAALALDGVEAVVTGEDIGDHKIGPFIKDETALAVGKVRYMGEPVAAVAAVDLETAKQAAQIDRHRLRGAAGGLRHRRRDGGGRAGPAREFGRLHQGLRGRERRQRDGDHRDRRGRRTASAWENCAAIVEGSYETQAQCHSYMEPCSALAEIDSNGKITIWSSNQSVFHVQAFTADSLGIPMSKVRCVTPQVGGAFGGKMEQTVQPAAAALARATGRPVKVTLTREQDFEMIRARHPGKVWMKTGAAADGTLLAREVRIVLDAGAYADDSPGVAGIAALFCRGPYRIENVSIESRPVYTNKLRSGAFRGFGGPQVAIAGETQIDEIADKLGMDPIDVRLKNAVRPGEEWMIGVALNKAGLVGVP